MAKKVMSGYGCAKCVDFKADVKFKTAPVIIDEFMDDVGEVTYILENGNTQTKMLYENLWGKPKGKVLPKHTKGEHIDTRSNWYN